MPLMDGLEVLAWIQKHPELQSLPVIILSGSTDAADIEAAEIMAAGREKRVLFEADLGSAIAGTATAANGVVYVSTMSEIWALGK